MQLALGLLLLVGSALAATHVNISIAQHPADVKYVDGQAPAELRAGPSSSSRSSHRLSEYRSEGRSAQLKDAGDSAASSQDSSMMSNGNDRTTYVFPQNSHMSQQQQQQMFSQLRKKQEAKQNQEFERYIQNYHSGPTVETVFESASPSTPQRLQQHSSSKSERLVAGPSHHHRVSSSRVHTFERQVALPVASSTGEMSSQQQQQPQASHQVRSSQSDAAYTSSASVSSPSVVASGVSSADVASASAEKPVYEPAGSSYSNNNNNNYDKYNYNGNSDDLLGQLPPLVSEQPQDGGYATYAGSDSGDFYSPKLTPGYLPAAGGPSPQPQYPRPVVTKTIQIAQPALKAKKYEIRHPAIQKEFYDIEERVVIKPAGTIVVELEHPVAKISKGETIVPLGHPHPAVADAYTNSNDQSVVQTQSVPFGGGSGGSAQGRKSQYAPNLPAKTAISSTTIASTLAASPSYDGDRSGQQDYVDASLKRPYGNDKQYVAPVAPERSVYDEAKTSVYNNNDDDLSSSEGERFYGGSYDSSSRRDETDSLPRAPVQVQVSNNGAPNTYSSSGSIVGQEQHITQYQPQPQPQHRSQHRGYNNVQYRGSYASSQQQGPSSFQSGASSSSSSNNNNNNNEFVGEYLNRELYNNPNYQQQDFKPARLQEAPAEPAPRTQVIKHEHQIHLPPSQHNIYLSQQQRYPSHERPDERARVQEIKPYLQTARGSVVVYASPAPAKQYADAPRYSQRQSTSSYQGHQQQQQQPHQQQYHQQQYRDDMSHRVQYSPAYSKMHYMPRDEMVGGKQETFSLHYNSPSKAKANLMKDDSPTVDEDDSDVVEAPQHHKSHDMVKGQETHIQIQIPQRDEPDTPIMVSSTVSPPMSSGHHSSSQSRYTDDAETLSHVEPKPDCDQPELKSNARYTSGRLSHRQQQKFLRLVDSVKAANDESVSAGSGVSPNAPALQADAVDLNVKGSSGQVTPSGPVPSRVIAATPAPLDHPGSESYHSRRIVVNHPFQTIREVVEHEPVTNYHQIQVPAMPAHYQTQFSHGDLRDFPSAVSYYHNAQGFSGTHGNLRAYNHYA